jgi:hypothetical protein
MLALLAHLAWLSRFLLCAAFCSVLLMAGTLGLPYPVS